MSQIQTKKELRVQLLKHKNKHGETYQKDPLVIVYCLWNSKLEDV